MRKTKEILRLRLGEKLSLREVARSVGNSTSTVHDTEVRAKAAGVGWPLPPDMGEADLETRLYPPAPNPRSAKAPVDMEYIHREMRRKGVTLYLLWQEYKQAHAEDGYQYSPFCAHYRRYRKTLDVVMRQEHKAGDKIFVDWSGDGIDITNPKTGEVTEAELFVAVLGASNYTFARAYPSQELRFWIQGHMLAYEYCRGVPAATVPDNTRTAVTSPCRYEPDVNKTYLEMANHYDTAVIPARSYKPRDKAKVETGVLIAQRWILAALRNHIFFSIEDANAAIEEKLVELNRRPFKKMSGCRRELFETIDRPALRPLPQRRYEFADWSMPKVNIDYHVEVGKHSYSVPYTLIHKRLDARMTATTVELLYRGSRVASHPRSYHRGRYTTQVEHMPKAHQKHLEWTPTRILNWATKTGPSTQQLAAAIMESRPHPEQGYKACLGILRLGKTCGDERVEAACKRALAIGSPSYRTVKSILDKRLDQQELPSTSPTSQPSLPLHENVRGSIYYQ